MLYRRAVISDIPAIISLGVESVSRDPLPLTISGASMSATASMIIGNNAHFSWVAEHHGTVVGSVCAQTHFGFWFERQQCSVLLYYGRLPNSVMPLLRIFAAWVKSRPVIKMAVIELEPATDPRLPHVLGRLGFTRSSTNVTYVRGK